MKQDSTLMNLTKKFLSLVLLGVAGKKQMNLKFKQESQTEDFYVVTQKLKSMFHLINLMKS